MVPQPTMLQHAPTPVELNYIFLSDNSAVVLSSTKLIFILAKFKMAASSTSVKEFHVLK
jgi:hypothetical protein